MPKETKSPSDLLCRIGIGFVVGAMALAVLAFVRTDLSYTLRSETLALSGTSLLFGALWLLAGALKLEDEDE